MSINTREELEEERRLFYVVITRAKQSFGSRMPIPAISSGSCIRMNPAGLLMKFPEEFLDRSFAGGGLRNQGGGFGNSSAAERMRGWGGGASREAGVRSQQPTSSRQPAAGSRPSYISPKSVPAKPVEHLPAADFKPSDTSELKAGQKVEHQKFGFGEVLKMEGAAHNPIATIKFELNGEKKIMLNYAKLRILE